MKNTKEIAIQKNAQHIVETYEETSILKAGKIIRDRRPKTERSQRSLNRSGVNKRIENNLMSFDVVYKEVRKDLFLLPNRVTMKHINENKGRILGTIRSLCGEKASEKVMYFDRLPEILTNRNKMIWFMTVSQLQRLEKGKKFTASQIVDIIAKILALKPATYDRGINKYNEQKRIKDLKNKYRS